MSERDEFGAFLVGFIVGGLTGAVVALLFAPQSGEETRALIKDKSIELRDKAHVIDTSFIRSAQLQGYVKTLVSVAANQLTLVFQSFAFKRGVPVDADYVFDVRMLPNPHYEPALRALTGKDAPVVEFLEAHADVAQMGEHIAQFLSHWLDAMAQNHRSYVTVCIGCTGGQHRSVYLVEALSRQFSQKWLTLKRHRELDAI